MEIEDEACYNELFVGPPSSESIQGSPVLSPAEYVSAAVIWVNFIRLFIVGGGVLGCCKDYHQIVVRIF